MWALSLLCTLRHSSTHKKNTIWNVFPSIFTGTKHLPCKWETSLFYCDKSVAWIKSSQFVPRRKWWIESLTLAWNFIRFGDEENSSDSSPIDHVIIPRLPPETTSPKAFHFHHLLWGGNKSSKAWLRKIWDPGTLGYTSMKPKKPLKLAQFAPKKESHLQKTAVFFGKLNSYCYFPGKAKHQIAGP